MAMPIWQIRQKVDMRGGAEMFAGDWRQLLVPGDKLAHRWIVEVYDNGESPATELGYYTASATFVRMDGRKLTATGSIAGNVITVDLPAECYNVPGVLRGVMQITRNYGAPAVSLSELWFRVADDLSGTTVVPMSEIEIDSYRNLVWEGVTYVDVSDSGVTEADVRDGVSFYDADGQRRTGKLDVTVAGTSSATATVISGEDYRVGL